MYKYNRFVIGFVKKSSIAFVLQSFFVVHYIFAPKTVKNIAKKTIKIQRKTVIFYIIFYVSFFICIIVL